MSWFAFCVSIGGATCAGAVEALREIDPVVVTATRSAERSADLPASIDRVDSTTIRAGRLQVNLSESLLTVPGVSAQSRQNYAQDLQMSVRGFGARSTFGVRGVRLYSDGIPGTMPDGQGQFSHFDLSGADRIEVLRGPFSALYGNSSGGVIAVFTEDAPVGFTAAGAAEYGSFNTQRYGVKTTGGDGAINYVIDGSHFQTDGYRDHSSAERNLFNSKVRIALPGSATLTLIGNGIETPFVQDPLGLTAAQLGVDRRQAGTGAIAYDTRKSLSQEQAGVIYAAPVGAEDDFTGTIYAGHRRTTQFQSIPQATERAAPLYPGGVIDLSRAFWGVDAHIADHRIWGDTSLRIVGGVSYDDLEESRKGYLNYVGNELGVEGALRRDLANHVYDADEYLQVEYDPNTRWRLTAGARNSVIEIGSHDHLVEGEGLAGSVRYAALNPVAGVTFRVTSAVNVYAAYGKGFETPTLDELAYRSTAGNMAGLNLALRPARSRNYEVGIKAGGKRLRATLAGFYIETRDELAVLANSGGRAVYQNIGGTGRHGVELALDADWRYGFSSRVAYTYIRALVAQAYTTCSGPPCAAPSANAPPSANDVRVPGGNYLPAVPVNTLYAGLTWRYAPSGFSVTLEEQARAQIYANDRNTAAAGGYWITNLRAGFEQESRRFRFTEYGSLDNLTNRVYVGSVIVNETNSRFYEPAPGRTAFIMFNAALRAN